VFRPTGFADLVGKRVGVFGYGVEGRAAVARLGATSDLVIVDDAEDLAPGVLTSAHGGLDALLTCDVVLKSPGIPRRRADVLELEAHGVNVTSALNLWLHESELARVVAVTGTKGKSTTTALITFFFECLGQRAQALGNIGRPPYDPSLDTNSGWLVLEVSSFQALDLDLAPVMVVVTSLGADHLDWHGSLEQYYSDKLSLTRAAGDHTTLVADSETLREVATQLGGDLHYVTPDEDHLARALGLIGAHNDANVALALRAVSTLAKVSERDLRVAVLERAATFMPLPGRLTPVAEEDTEGGVIRYVDDGLATSVLPTVAALDVFEHDPVALIVGGFDRGIDYGPLAEALLHRHAPTALVTMGNAGARVSDQVRRRVPGLEQHVAATMGEAVNLARGALKGGGVVLLSPAAPSFDRYHNWEERSADFVGVVRDTLH
jgi:UDP-N-acetylmuramoylalanine--D-glutamate ligase